MRRRKAVRPMSNDDAKTLAELRSMRDSLSTGRASSFSASTINQSVALIDRLAADVARKDAEIERLNGVVKEQDENHSVLSLLRDDADEDVCRLKAEIERLRCIADMVELRALMGARGEWDERIVRNLLLLRDEQLQGEDDKAATRAVMLQDVIEYISRLVKDLAGALSEIERATLRWSSETPTVVGDYHMRYKDEPSHRWVGELDGDDLSDPDNSEWLADKEFAGPIATPLEQAGEEISHCRKCGHDTVGVLRGGQPFNGEESVTFGVQCGKCGHIGETKPTRNEAIAAWNQEPTT